MKPQDPEELSIEECAELLLNLSAAAADMQVDDESREAIYYCLDRVAEHFGIPVIRETLPTTTEEGIVLHVKEHHQDNVEPIKKNKGPVFRVIDGGEPDRDVVDNDDWPPQITDE